MKSIAYDEPLRAEEQGDIRLTPYNGCGPRFLDTGRFNSITTPHSIGAPSSSREGAPFPPVFGRKRLEVQRGYSSPFAFGSLRIASGAWIDTTGGTLAAFLSRVIQSMILVTKMSKRFRNVGNARSSPRDRGSAALFLNHHQLSGELRKKSRSAVQRRELVREGKCHGFGWDTKLARETITGRV